MRFYPHFFTLFVFLGISGDVFAASDATITITNHSAYHMMFASWKNGKDCSDKIALDASFNLNSSRAQTISVPAGKLIAFGISIVQVQDKLPIMCDYILSFKLSPGAKYTIDYDVRDRGCYGQLYQLKNETYQMVEPGGPEHLSERIPEFGWDQFEPGCEEL